MTSPRGAWREIAPSSPRPPLPSTAALPLQLSVPPVTRGTVPTSATFSQRAGARPPWLLLGAAGRMDALSTTYARREDAREGPGQSGAALTAASPLAGTWLLTCLENKSGKGAGFLPVVAGERMELAVR